MKRLAIVVVLGTACSSGHKPPISAATGSGSGVAIYAKKMVIGWGFHNGVTTTDVFLQTTDEAGNQISHPLGTYQGTCVNITPGAAMKATSGVACNGLELHALIEGDDIVVLKLPSGTRDPMAREEVTRIPVPPGTAIR